MRNTGTLYNFSFLFILQKWQNKWLSVIEGFTVVVMCFIQCQIRCVPRPAWRPSQCMGWRQIAAVNIGWLHFTRLYISVILAYTQCTVGRFCYVCKLFKLCEVSFCHAGCSVWQQKAVVTPLLKPSLSRSLRGISISASTSKSRLLWSLHKEMPYFRLCEQCHILLIPVLLPSWMVARLGYILQMMMM